MHQVLMNIQSYLLPMQRAHADHFTINTLDFHVKVWSTRLTPRCQFISPHSCQKYINIYTNYYIQTPCILVLFSLDVLHIPSERMLVVRNSVKLHRVGQYLNLEYTRNCFYESVQSVPLTNMPQSLTTSNIHLRHIHSLRPWQSSPHKSNSAVVDVFSIPILHACNKLFCMQGEELS